MSAPLAYPAMTELLPHGEGLVLLDRMLEWEPGRALCGAHITVDSPFFRDGGVDATVSIEYMAQAVAACLGYEAFRDGNGVRVGVIIATRELELREAFLPLQQDLDISVRRTRGNDSLSHFAASIATKAEPSRIVASATMTLYHAKQVPEDR